MTTESKDQQLFKILFSAAWLDGEIQMEERQHLHQMAHDLNISELPDIKALLSEAVPIKPEDCYRLVEEYMGSNPTTEDFQHLLDAVSALIYSDGNVDVEEAKLLNRLQYIESELQHHSVFHNVIKSLQKLYKEAVQPHR